MAAVKRFFAHCGQNGFSKQISKGFLCRYGFNCSYDGEGRCFSMLASHRLILLRRRSDYSKSYFVFLPIFCNKKGIQFRTLSSSVPEDAEFVSESVLIRDENIQDLTSFSEMIQMVKEKTGVIIKTLNEDNNGAENKDTKVGGRILVGGTRHEVQQAVFYIKSLLNQNSQEQKIIMLQDDQINEQHLEKEEKPIWAYYRRNFKGQKPPMKTRKKCIRGTGESQSVSGNPCPICRLYLAGGYELNYKDIDLLSQFISPHTGEVFDAVKTGVCRLQQKNLIKAIQTAKDFGLLPYSVPGARSIVKPPEHAQIPRNVRLK